MKKLLLSTVLSFLFFLFLALFSACAADEVPTPPTNQSMIAEKYWEIVACRLNDAVNVYDTWAKCEKDDVWYFAAGNNFYHYEGATKCAANEIVEQGKFKFIDDSTIEITINNERKTYTIGKVEKDVYFLLYLRENGNVYEFLFDKR